MAPSGCFMHDFSLLYPNKLDSKVFVEVFCTSLKGHTCVTKYYKNVKVSYTTPRAVYAIPYGPLILGNSPGKLNMATFMQPHVLI